MTIERDPVYLVYEGVTYYTEREVTRVDDWRETAFGPVNFGYVRWGEPRWRPEHPAAAILAKPSTVPRKWWQFWRSPA